MHHHPFLIMPPPFGNLPRMLRAASLSAALAGLAGCATDTLDWDMRNRTSALNTSQAAQAATTSRPAADARGVLSYPGYQVAVARRGDTVTTVANRVGLDAVELARYNAIEPGQTLRAGELLVLPSRVANAAPLGTGGQTSGIDVTTLAANAIDRAAGATPAASAPSAATAAGAEPVRHKVVRGETAYSIARTYNVSARALADWNGLDADMNVREGQTLLIPVATQPAPARGESAPGAGSPTPLPPSASLPLPAQDEAAASAPAPDTPASPDLGAGRSAASAATYVMPVAGKIIRTYQKGRNEGIDIAAPAGTAVRAAANGTVAAITKDTDQVKVLVLRHADGRLTVYASVTAISVAKGASVKRGQTIAAVAAADPAILHFEVRDSGGDSTDPMAFLQ